MQELRKSMHDMNERFSCKIETLKRNQAERLEMKYSIFQTKGKYVNPYSLREVKRRS